MLQLDKMKYLWATCLIISFLNIFYLSNIIYKKKSPFHSYEISSKSEMTKTIQWKLARARCHHFFLVKRVWNGLN